jgi:hypothetical protein
MVTIKMNKKEDDIAHPGNGINTSKTQGIQPNLVIRIRQAGISAGTLPFSRLHPRSGKRSPFVESLTADR